MISFKFANCFHKMYTHTDNKIEEIEVRKQFEISEDHLPNNILDTPILLATFKGSTFIIETVNKIAPSIWGKSYEEVINTSVFDSSPELESGLKSLLTGVFKTGKTFISKAVPVQLIRLGKPYTAYFNLVYQSLHGLNDNIEGISLIGTEITKAENPLMGTKETDLISRTILESSPDCLKLIELDGRILYMNYNGLCQMEIDNFYTVENKIWWTLWGSENEAVVKASIDNAKKGQSTKFTAFCPTAKGTPKWWDVSVFPVRKPGEPVNQIMSVSRDITKQKKFQEALDKMASDLKLATDAANLGVWSLKMQTQELEWSTLHKKLWGYDEHRTDITYEDWHNIIIPEDKALVLKSVENAMVNYTLYEVEYQIKKADDNALRFIRSVGKYYYNDNGEAETFTGISIDITEQKEAEKKVRESENQFRTFADSIQNLAWIANAEGSVYWYNQKWYDYTGTTLEEMEGWGWLKVHHPDHIQKVLDFIRKAWTKDEAFELIFPLRRYDGEYRWFLTRSYPVKDAQGNIERWIGTNTDITEQKQTEHQLNESENFNKSILSSLNAHIAVIDYSGNLIAVNKAWKNFAIENGITSICKVSSGSNYFDVCKPAIENGDTFAAQALLGIQSVLNKEKHFFEMEYPCHTPQQQKWFMLNVVNFGNDTNQAVISHQDITERKKIEEELRNATARLQLATNAASIGVWDYNVLDNTLIWDDNMHKLYGITPDKFLAATEAWEAGIHPDDLLQAREDSRMAIRGEREYKSEFRVVWPDKSVHYIKADAFLFKDANGIVSRMIGTNQDITEQTQFEIQKEKMMQDIVQRNENLEQFSYIVSHNLRLPVANILGFINLLQDADIPMETMNVIKGGLSTSAKKMDEVIRDLTGILQLNQNVNEKKEFVNFTHLATDVYISIETTIIKEKATITWDFSEATEMMTIKSYLYSIFYNLISNSIKYHQTDIPPIIKIISQKTDDKIILIFKDNGLGIDLEKNGNQIFGLYKRFHIDRAEGKGMGLYMVKTQLEAIGGSISIQSQVNEGSQFRIEFSI